MKSKKTKVLYVFGKSDQVDLIRRNFEAGVGEGTKSLKKQRRMME